MNRSPACSPVYLFVTKTLPWPISSELLMVNRSYMCHFITFNFCVGSLSMPTKIESCKTTHVCGMMIRVTRCFQWYLDVTLTFDVVNFKRSVMIT